MKGDCLAGESGCGPDELIMQYHLTTRRLINLTPRIEWYMMSPSQHWLVFADYHGLYVLEFGHEGQPVGQPLQIHFEPYFGYTGRWILVGFSHDESTFTYGSYDRYYTVTLPASVSEELHDLPISEEAAEEFLCTDYTAAARYYRKRRGITYRKGQARPVTDRCEDDESHKNTLFHVLRTFHINLIPDWASDASPQQPCATTTPDSETVADQYAQYTLQFAGGDEALVYERLLEYGEYLDSLGLRVRLERDVAMHQFRLRWGQFPDFSTAEAAQACLKQRFQLDGQIVSLEEIHQSNATQRIMEYPLKSFGRIVSPDTTKTVYIKNVWSISFPEPLTEIWMTERGSYYEYHDFKVVDAIRN